MHWFAQFVDETVQEYRRQTLSEKRAGFLEELEAIIEEQKVSARWSGFLGEKAIQTRLEQCGYVTKLSPGSRSPSDIWGIKKVGDILHVAMVQSKASGKDGSPQRLTREEEADLFSFTTFVFRQFGSSETVPGNFKQMPRIVSASYAGVALEGPEVAYITSIYYGAHSSSLLDEKWGEHEAWLRAVHNFE